MKIPNCYFVLSRCSLTLYRSKNFRLKFVLKYPQYITLNNHITLICSGLRLWKPAGRNGQNPYKETVPTVLPVRQQTAGRWSERQEHLLTWLDPRTQKKSLDTYWSVIFRTGITKVYSETRRKPTHFNLKPERKTILRINCMKSLTKKESCTCQLTCCRHLIYDAMKTESEQLIGYILFVVWKENLPTSSLFTVFLTNVGLNPQVYRDVT
jgi:hypothetical protein